MIDKWQYKVAYTHQFVQYMSYTFNTTGAWPGRGGRVSFRRGNSDMHDGNIVQIPHDWNNNYNFNFIIIIKNIYGYFSTVLKSFQG